MHIIAMADLIQEQTPIVTEVVVLIKGHSGRGGRKKEDLFIALIDPTETCSWIGEDVYSKIKDKHGLTQKICQDGIGIHENPIGLPVKMELPEFGIPDILCQFHEYKENT